MSSPARLALCLAATLVFPASVFATKGFGLIENDAQTAAMHGGAAALIANPAAARLNPANLSLLNATSVASTLTLYNLTTDFTAPNGRAQSSEKPWKPAGSLFVATPLSPNITLGFGIDTPYGTSMRWAPQGLFKYSVPHSGDLQMLDFIGSLGYRVSETFRVGVELDVFRASLNLKQFYPWLMLTGNPATLDGAMEFDGRDICVSGGLAFSWTPVAGHRVAVVAHLPTAIRFSGDFTITNIPVPLPGVSARSDFTATLRMPADVTLSYAWDVTSSLTLGAEAQWIGNSVVDQLSADVRGNNALFPSTVTPLNWSDSYTLGLGGRLRVSPTLSLLAGYQYADSPMNPLNYTPLIAGNDKQLFSTGLAYIAGHFSCNFAYNYGVHRTLNLRNNAQPAFNGRHEFDLQVFSVSAGWRF